MSIPYWTMLYRKICQLGLKKVYEGAGVISDWLKLFFGLPFFDASAVLDAFCEIMSCTPPDPRCIAFRDYVQDNFILLCAFPPEMWAEIPRALSPRTTNGAEVFHHHFRGNFYGPHLHVYYFIEALKDVQTETCVKIRSIRSPPLQSKKVREKLLFLLQTYDELINNELSTLQFLKKVGM